jgi:hypothetical protein
LCSNLPSKKGMSYVTYPVRVRVKRFMKAFFHFCHPSRVQATNDGRSGLLLHVYFKQYMTTAVFTSRMMQKRRLQKIVKHLRRYLEALLHFFLRGQNTAATLYKAILIIIYILLISVADYRTHAVREAIIASSNLTTCLTWCKSNLFCQ